MRFLFSILFFAWFVASWAREDEKKQRAARNGGPGRICARLRDAARSGPARIRAAAGHIRRSGTGRVQAVWFGLRRAAADIHSSRRRSRRRFADPAARDIPPLDSRG